MKSTELDLNFTYYTLAPYTLSIQTAQQLTPVYAYTGRVDLSLA